MSLRLVKRKDTPNYYIRGSVMGIRVNQSTGTDLRKYAEAIRIKTETRLLDEAVFGAKSVVGFDEAARSYGADIRYVGRLIAHFGSVTVHSIRQADLDKAARVLYPTASGDTRNRQCYTPFIAIWNHAVVNGWAEVRRWQRPRKPKGTNVVRVEKRNGTRPTTFDIAAAFVNEMSPAPAMVMTALFYTGLRPIELFLLDGSDVSISDRWIVVRSSKTGEPRGVPLHEFLVPMFESLMERSGIVFRTHTGQPYPIMALGGGQIKSAIKGARKRSGIIEISPYTARHTVSTQLVINGVHPHIKDQILGHAADDMSRRYTNVPQKTLIEAINTLPVPENWRALPWWSDPLASSSKLVKWGKGDVSFSEDSR